MGEIMVKKIKYNEDEAKTLALELKKEVIKLRASIAKLETNVGLLQTSGNWNGANAYDVNKGLVGHLDHDKTLLNRLEKCSETLKASIE